LLLVVVFALLLGEMIRISTYIVLLLLNNMRRRAWQQDAFAYVDGVLFDRKAYLYRVEMSWLAYW